MKKILSVLIVLCLSGSIYAQTFVNPGIKFGYSFGKDGGFVFGWELSVTFWDSYYIWGFVFDYDTINNLDRLHIGVEFWRAGIGLDVGPSFAWEDGNNFAGFSIIPYGGAIIYPYYNYTYLWKRGSSHEIGSYLKLSIGSSRFRMN